jgi:hypothetical protein
MDRTCSAAMKTITKEIRSAFLALVIVQAAHFLEEYHFRLYEVFAPARLVSGLISTDLRTGFIIFNSAFLAFGFWCYAVPVSKGWAAAIPLIWVWIVVEVLNGAGHPLISILEHQYTPGTATAPVLLIIAIYLSIQVVASTRTPRT